MIAFEVKASPNVGAEDARGLQALSRRVGEDQCTCILLHTGRAGFRLDKTTFALPIGELWAER